jgi:hypothetical protein
MSNKQRYLAGRFVATRFAAGRFKGGGTYQPDFMHGRLETYVHVLGEVSVKLDVVGDVNTYPAVRGKIEINK